MHISACLYAALVLQYRRMVQHTSCEGGRREVVGASVYSSSRKCKKYDYSYLVMVSKPKLCFTLEIYNEYSPEMGTERIHHIKSSAHVRHTWAM